MTGNGGRLSPSLPRATVRDDTYTTPTRWTFGLNTETSYDWETEQWSVPINVSASNLLRVGNQLVSAGGGLRYWLDSADSGAEGLGVRITITLLFPR